MKVLQNKIIEQTLVIKINLILAIMIFKIKDNKIFKEKLLLMIYLKIEKSLKVQI